MTGTRGRRFASPSMAVYDIDISWSKLRQDARVAGEREVHGVDAALARVGVLPFRGGQFDAANCVGALHGFPATVGSLRKMGRRLKPGTRLVVLTSLDRDQCLSS